MSPRDDSHATQHPLPRRRMLGRLALSGAAVAAGSAVPVRSLLASPAIADRAPLPAVHTPDDAMHELTAGNRRFVEGRALGPNRTMTRVKDVAAEQAPFAAVLSCADSRVPVEIVFDQGVGDLFVCRAAGNIVTPELLASLEFGTLVLGARAIVVLGHTSCGAVKATIDGGAVPGQISTLYQHIQPAVDRVAASGAVDVEAVARENVRQQVRLLERSSPVIAGLVKEGRLVVSGGVYDLASGYVERLDA